MDIDLPQHGVAGVNESMRCIRGNDHDAARFHVVRLISDRNSGATFKRECDLGVGVSVQRRPVAGLCIDDVSRDRRALFVAVKFIRHSYKRQLLKIGEAHRVK